MSEEDRTRLPEQDADEVRDALSANKKKSHGPHGGYHSSGGDTAEVTERVYQGNPPPGGGFRPTVSKKDGSLISAEVDRERIESETERAKKALDELGKVK